MVLFLLVATLASATEGAKCPLPTVPLNGAVAIYQDIAIPFCRGGTYPSTAWPSISSLFTCQKDEWLDMTTSVNISSIEGCTDTTPPNGLNPVMFESYQFTLNCQTKSGANQIRDKYIWLLESPMSCRKEEIDVHCDET